MASTAHSGGEPFSSGTLYFLICHIFLPPYPNTTIRANAANERKLMQTVHDALARFCASLDVAQSHVVDRCTQMLECMMDAHSARDMCLKSEVLKQQMAGLGNNGTCINSFQSTKHRQTCWYAGERVNWNLMA